MGRFTPVVERIGLRADRSGSTVRYCFAGLAPLGVRVMSPQGNLHSPHPMVFTLDYPASLLVGVSRVTSAARAALD